MILKELCSEWLAEQQQHVDQVVDEAVAGNGHLSEHLLLVQVQPHSTTEPAHHVVFNLPVLEQLGDDLLHTLVEGVKLLGHGVGQSGEPGQRLLRQAAPEILLLEALGLLGQAGEREVPTQVGLHLQLLTIEVRG